MQTKILAGLTIMTLAPAGCGRDQPPPPPPSASAGESVATGLPADAPLSLPPKPALTALMRGAMRKIHEGFNAHDAAKMASVVTEDVAVYGYGSVEMHTKRDFQNGMTQLFQWFSGARTSSNRMWERGNVVIDELTWVGTMTGAAMGMKATNKPVGEIRVHVYSFNDEGLIKEVHGYGDDAGLIAQMQGGQTGGPMPVLPANPPEMHVANGGLDDDKPADLAKAYDEAYSKDDAKAVLDLATDEGDVWVSLGIPTMKGKAQHLAGLKDWFRAFPDQKWSTVNAWGIDGFAILEHVMNGTQQGALGPLHGSGDPVSNWHWLDIEQWSADGKMQHDWGYANLAEVIAQTEAKKPNKN